MRPPLHFLALASLSLLVHGCSPPVVSQSTDGPTISLSNEEPVAEFSVRLCYRGPTGDRFETTARVYADLNVENGDTKTVTFGQSYLEGEDPVEEPPPSDVNEESPTDRDAPDTDWQTRGFLGFDIDAFELADTGGCLEPRTVRFELGEVSDDVTVEVEWRTSLSVEFHRKAPDQDDLSVEIQRL